MAIIQHKPKRKISGGRYNSRVRSKKQIYRGSDPTHPKIGATKKKAVRTRGGSIKVKVIRSEVVNLFDGKSYSQAKIITVVENTANRNYVRRNILTKGTVVNTDKGKAKITNRPGQEGVVNAVLLK
jgi:small subunit ribosomal protein S8e